MSNPNQSYFDKYFDPVVRDIDRVNIYEFENGMDYELVQSGEEINLDSIKKAQAKVLKNLKKDPAYYTNMLAAESIKMFGEYGTGKGRSIKSSTAKEAEAVKKDGKMPKENKQDSPFGTKQEVKGKYKSSGMEPVKKVPGALNESVTPAQIAKLKDIAADWKKNGTDKQKDGADALLSLLQREEEFSKEKESLKSKNEISMTGNKDITYNDPAEYYQGHLMPEEDKNKEKSAYDKKREEDKKAEEMAKNAMKRSLGIKKEGVDVADSRKIRLTPTTKNQILTLVHEMTKKMKEGVAYKVDGEIASFPDDAAAQKFKSQNSNIQNIQKL